jgi:hypothetical protein
MYLKYETDFNLTFKAGRQGLPIFAVADKARVTVELPYRGKPTYVYLVAPYSAFDGASLEYEISIGEAKLHLMAFGGQLVNDIFLEPVINIINATDLWGARVNLSGDGWKLRAQASQNFTLFQINPFNMYQNFLVAKVNNTPVYAVSNSAFDYGGNNQIFTAGFTFDKANFVSWLEVIHNQSFNGSLAGGVPFWGSETAGYWLLGARLGNFLPRYTFSRAISHAGIGKGAVSSHIVGCNYEIQKGMIVKTEFEVDTFNPGNYIDVVGNAYLYGSTPTDPSQKPQGKNAKSFFLGIDFLI